MIRSGPAADAARFVFEPLADGGILLDVQTGLIFEMNPSAALIWENALAGADAGALAGVLTHRYGIPGPDAARAVTRALTLPQTASVPAEVPPYRYQLVNDRYLFSDAHSPLLDVDPDGRVVRALGTFSPAAVGLYLTSLTPKVAALLGLSVVHASAVADPRGHATLFLGQSGAGKSTTARALATAAASWTLLSEDKVVLRLDAGQVGVAVDGERRIVSWIAEARERLAGGEGRTCATEGLAAAGGGAACPVRKVILVDAARRAAGPMQLARLGQTRAAREIFQAGFYGSSAPAAWRRQLDVTATVARSAETYAATMPRGLSALAEMASTYAETITS